MVRQGRWVQLLTEALEQVEAVGVRAAVREHVGRPPTRNEMTSAHYAARRLVEAGVAESVRQHVVAGSMHHGGDYVVLVRPGGTPDEATLRLAAIGRSLYPGTIEEQRQVNAGRADEALDLVAQAATAAGRVDHPHLLDERDAVTMADQLGVAINELAAVRRRLARRGREEQTRTAAG